MTENNTHTTYPLMVDRTRRQRGDDVGTMPHRVEVSERTIVRALNDAAQAARLAFLGLGILSASILIAAAVMR